MSIRDLIELGLTEVQAKIYLKLLEVNQSSVLKLSRELNVQRPTIYDNLNKLEQLGLVGWIVEKGRKAVQPTNPVQLVQMLAIKQKKAEELLPRLQEIYSSSQPASPKVAFFHGNEGYKRLANIIPTAQDRVIRSIGSYRENVQGGFTDRYLKELWQNRSRRHIKARVLFTHADKELLAKDKAYSEIGNIRYNREVRILPQGIKLAVLYTLVDDKVLFWSSKKEDFGLLFQSQSYASSLKTLFDYLWEVSPTQ